MSSSEVALEIASSPASKKARVESSVSIVRDVIVPKLPLPSNTCKIFSWNVAGLRGTLKNSPEIFLQLVAAHSPDVLCLQETKLQENHVAELEGMLPGYKSYWSCSTTKKGYSGTATFVKNSLVSSEAAVANTEAKKPKQGTISGMWKSDKTATKKQEETSVELASSSPKLLGVKYDLPDARFNGEGRVITAEFDSFYLINCYVPNSGDGLVRLDFRVNEWDPYIVSYLDSLRKKKPVVYAGDLNCGHLDLDIYNFDAKHIVKQAGLTPRERASFTNMLEAGYFDALRQFYPGRVVDFAVVLH